MVERSSDLGSMWAQTPMQMMSTLQRVPNTTPRLLGLTALKADYGFRADGSLHNDSITAEVIASNMQEDRLRFQNRTSLYTVGQTVNFDALKHLESILTTAQTHHTHLIAILPPFHPEFWQLMNNSDDFNYRQPARDALAQLVASYNITIYDFSNPTSIAANANEFIDSWHSSEAVYLRMVMEILKNQPDLLGEYVDPDHLEQLLSVINSNP